MSKLDEAVERLERFRAVTIPRNGLSAHPLEDDVHLVARALSLYRAECAAWRAFDEATGDDGLAIENENVYRAATTAQRINEAAFEQADAVAPGESK